MCLTTGTGWDAWFTEGSNVNLKIKPFYIKLVWKNFGIERANLEDGGPILEAIQDEKFVFIWYPIDKYTPITVTFELKPLQNGTYLEVYDSGYNNTKKHLLQLIDCAQGWAEAMTLLKFYLEHNVTYGEVPF